ADLYSVWTTDSSGNWLSTGVAGVSGTSFALEALEPSFQQDLNGDGTIGPPGMTVIETNGSTRLTQVGNQYFLYNSSGVGRALQCNCAPVVPGEFSNVPIGAEQTATGFDVAFMLRCADLYSVWTTDSSGNWVSTGVAGVSGTNATLEALEPSFQQDLNGDGIL